MSKKQKNLLHFFRNTQASTATLLESGRSGDSTKNIEKVSEPRSMNSGCDDNNTTITRDPGPACLNATVDLIKGPCQPILEFNKREYGKEKKLRSFQSSWYSMYPWLEYSVQLDAAFCFYCRAFCAHQPGCADEAFVKKGVTNWKRALEKFKKHDESVSHIRAQQFFAGNRSLKKNSVSSVAEQISSFHQETVEKNRNYCKFIFETILWLGKQGVAFRGHNETRNSFNRGNFIELIKLRCRDKQKDFEDMSQSKICNYLGAPIQNEIIKLIGDFITEKIVTEINAASCYSLIVDETTDASSKEQVAVGIRYCQVQNSKYVIKEQFLGFLDCPNTRGEELHLVLSNFLNHLDVPLNKMRGQGYDGASNMSGQFNGLAAQFKKNEPRALYFHCHAHLLNLAVARFCENIVPLRNALYVTNELYNVIEASAKRHSIFQNIIEEVCPSSKIKTLKILSQTRWTVRHKAVSTVIDLLPAIVATLTSISEDTTNPKVAAVASGLIKSILEQEFILSILILNLILGTTDLLSTELQSPTLNITSVNKKSSAVIKTIQDARNEITFNQIFEKMENITSEIETKGYDIKEIALPRQRKIPKKLDCGSGAAFHFSNAKEMVRINLFYTAIDDIVGNLKIRFSENDYAMVNKIVNCLTDHGNLHVEDVVEINKFYKLTDSDESLINQIRIYKQFLEKKETVETCAQIFLDNDLIRMLPAPWQMFEIILSCPVTSASAERFFSVLKRLKTYLRSTMVQERLTGLALMQIHQELVSSLLTDETSLDTLLNTFISQNTRRMMFF